MTAIVESRSDSSRSAGSFASHVEVSRGLAVGDLDGDGDPDLAQSNGDGTLRLFRNDGGNRNAWLRVALEGSVSNHDARGAMLRLEISQLTADLDGRVEAAALARLEPQAVR